MLKLQMSTVRDDDVTLQDESGAKKAQEDEEKSKKQAEEPGVLEQNMRIELLPLRINMDQDTMDVLISFGVDVGTLLEQDVDEADEDAQRAEVHEVRRQMRADDAEDERRNWRSQIDGGDGREQALALRLLGRVGDHRRRGGALGPDRAAADAAARL